MKKLIIFILFVFTIIALALLPVYAFYITDNSIYQTPIKRVSQWPQLSTQGEENLFAKTMFSRKNIYGPRFLKWIDAPEAKEESLAIFLSKIKEMCDAKVLSNEIYTLLEAEVGKPEVHVFSYKDAMNFKNIQVTLKDTSKYANMEINTATGTVYSLTLSVQASENIKLDSFIKYLSLDTFTDWQQINTNTGAYSESAQLYVYVQTQINNDMILGVFAMTPNEFENYV